MVMDGRKLKRRKAMKFLPSASLLVLEVHHQVPLLSLLLRAALALLLPTWSSAQGHGNQRNAEFSLGR